VNREGIDENKPLYCSQKIKNLNKYGTVVILFTCKLIGMVFARGLH
jgi:hypothetical protein